METLIVTDDMAPAGRAASTRWVTLESTTEARAHGRTQRDTRNQPHDLPQSWRPRISRSRAALALAALIGGCCSEVTTPIDHVETAPTLVISAVDITGRGSGRLRFEGAGLLIEAPTGQVVPRDGLDDAQAGEVLSGGAIVRNRSSGSLDIELNGSDLLDHVLVFVRLEGDETRVSGKIKWDVCETAPVVTLAPQTVCGDGFVEGSESCDDANDVSGDGCDRCASE